MTEEARDSDNGERELRERVDQALALVAGDRDELPGLVHLNTVRFPRLRFVGYQILLGWAALHQSVFGGGLDLGTFLPLLIVVEGYALGSWAILRHFYTRLPRLDLGDWFAVLDLPVFALVVLASGGSESHLWPIFLLRTADQLWLGKRRALLFAFLCVGSYLLVPAAEHWMLGGVVAWGEVGWRAGALTGIALMMVGVARQPLELQDRALAAREWILRLDRQSRELEEARRKAEAANEAKSDFLARMSHELRTPMNSVIGFTNVLLRDESLRGSERGREHLERIRGNGLHLLALINDVLDVTRIEGGRFPIQWGQVDLGGLVRETVEQFSARASEVGVELVLRLPPRLDPIRSDEVRLRQVLTNLVANALKFTRQGSVEVEVEVVAGTDGVPHALRVRDSGVGIAKSDLERIFLPFEQGERGTARSHSGTGLGLAIARSIADQLGYSLTVESRVGEGSTFSVVFAGPSEAEALEAPQDAPVA